MAMPYMEGVTEKSADQWLIQLTNQMKSIPQAKDKSILELQAQTGRKWSASGYFFTTTRSLDEPITTEWSENYGYYPDNFLHNQPEIDVIRPEFSTAWYPKMINRIVSFYIMSGVMHTPMRSVLSLW